MVLRGSHTSTVQVASLTSAALQTQLHVPGPGAGGQCQCGRDSPLGSQSSPLPCYNQGPTPAVPTAALKGPADRGLWLPDSRKSITASALLKPPGDCKHKLLPTHCHAQTQRTLERGALLFPLLPSGPGSGGGRSPAPEQQRRCRRPLAVLQFLLLKH